MKFNEFKKMIENFPRNFSEEAIKAMYENSPKEYLHPDFWNEYENEEEALRIYGVDNISEINEDIIILETNGKVLVSNFNR